MFGSSKILQVTAWYPPHSVGGTETYLEGLVTELSTRGLKCTIIVPRHSAAAESYKHGDTTVETYPVNEAPTQNEFRNGAHHLNFDAFIERLRVHSGAIYHQHSWSRGCGPHHLRAARAMGFRTVVTVHVPSIICLRGTMMRFGVEACNGLVNERLCGACWACERGLPKPLAELVAHLPFVIATGARRSAARLATALSARALGAGHLAGLHDMVENADHIVAVCQWLYDALAANGVPRSKLTLSRQGLTSAFRNAAATAVPRSQHGGPLRLLYIGRWHAVKGIDVVVRAVRALPASVNVLLSIHAVAPAFGEESYEAAVRILAADEPRITFNPPVPRERLIELINQHDVLVVPSVGLETGPLVVLEAQATGLFVLGSRLGGIAELVEGTASGTLVPAGDPAVWAQAIEHLAHRHATGDLPRTRLDVRSMHAVAGEMVNIYRELGQYCSG